MPFSIFPWLSWAFGPFPKLNDPRQGVTDVGYLLSCYSGDTFLRELELAYRGDGAEMTHVTRVGWGIWSFIFGVIVVLGMRQPVAAATIADAVQWLLAQAQTDGSYTTPADIAAPWQATAETVRSVVALGAIPPAGLTAALQFLTADTSPVTERLARQIIATVETGGSPTALVAVLHTLRNADGGYAPFPGYTSTVLDTAFALEAWAGSPAKSSVPRRICPSPR